MQSVRPIAFGVVQNHMCSNKFAWFLDEKVMITLRIAMHNIDDDMHSHAHPDSQSGGTACLARA